MTYTMKAIRNQVRIAFIVRNVAVFIQLRGYISLCP